MSGEEVGPGADGMLEIMRSVFFNSKDAIFTIDPQGKVTAANPTARKIFNISEGEMGKHFVDLSIFDDTARKDVTSFMGTGGFVDAEGETSLKVTFADGANMWLGIRTDPIKDNEGNTTGHIITASDITKRKEFEQAIIESAHRFRSLVENLHEGVGINDPDDNIIYANPALSRLLGFSVDELRGMNISDLVVPEDLQLIRGKTKTRMMGITDDYQTRMRCRDGTIKDVLVSAAPWTSERGEFKGSIGLLLDITDQKRAAKALKDSEEKYRATVEQSAENIYIFDVDTNKLIEVNQALCDLLGYTKEEMIGMVPGDFIAHEEQDVKGQIRKVLEKGRAIIGERKYTKKNGEVRDVEVSASHIKYGNRSMLCVVSRDVTEKKRARLQLIEERNRAEFYLDLLAHDVGNLHHGILSGLDLYSMSCDNAERQAKALDMVRQLLNRSLKLVENIKTFTKLSSEPIELEPMDVRALLENGAQSAFSSFPDVRIEHELSIRTVDATAMVEPLFQEALFNLYHNAIKFQDPERIRIETALDRNEKGGLRITISDHGQGISDDDKKDLFNRIKEPTKRKHTGLGLSLIKALVDRCNAKIFVEDRKAGHYRDGVRFIIEFPPAVRPAEP
ncbi:MAG: PAS domain S-box protein [Thermoplasmatota archaeon]